jgi:hypothetical protein
MRKNSVLTMILIALYSVGFSTNTIAQSNLASTYLVSLKLEAEFDLKDSKETRINRANHVNKASKDIARSMNVKVIDVFDYVLGGFSAELTKSQAEEISKSGQISKVQLINRNATLPLNQIQSGPDWGLDRIDQRQNFRDNKFQYGITGAGTDIFIFDTGIRSTHSEFTGRIGTGRNFANGSNDIEDCNGHGTAITSVASGTTLGIAKNAIVHPVRLNFGCNGGVSVYGVISGLNWVVSELASGNINNATVNMSFGGLVSQIDPSVIPLILAMEQSIRDSINSNVVVVISAGNEREDACGATPARVAEAITVGMTDIDDYQDYNSNFGSCVDIFAPGNNIASAGIASDNDIGASFGTSIAAPFATGVAALYCQYKPYSQPSNISDNIVSDATSNAIIDIGANSPNKLLYWHNYWNYIGGNSGSGSIYWWHISANDKYVSGDFNADGKDDMIAINSNGWHHTMNYSGGFFPNWQWIEGNGSSFIGSWNIRANDQYVSGDFNGDGRDEVLAINPNGTHQTLSFNGSSWQTIEAGNNLFIANWRIRTGDQYLIGDFLGDSNDELIAINPNGWQSTLKLSGNSWQFVQGNQGNRYIDRWLINRRDKYVVGDFQGIGKAQLLALNGVIRGPNFAEYQTIEFTNGFPNSNQSGLDYIGEWAIAYEDRYVSGDFTDDGKDELLVNNGYASQTIQFDGSNWFTLSDSADERKMGYWYFNYNDSYLRGKFDGGNTDFVMGINPNGWWQVSRYQ